MERRAIWDKIPSLEKDRGLPPGCFRLRALGLVPAGPGCWHVKKLMLMCCSAWPCWSGRHPIQLCQGMVMKDLHSRLDHLHFCWSRRCWCLRCRFRQTHPWHRMFHQHPSSQHCQVCLRRSHNPAGFGCGGLGAIQWWQPDLPQCLVFWQLVVCHPLLGHPGGLVGRHPLVLHLHCSQRRSWGTAYASTPAKHLPPGKVDIPLDLLSATRDKICKGEYIDFFSPFCSDS